MLKKIIISLIGMVFLPAVALADFNISEYKYYKDLLPTDIKKGNFSFKIDKDIYKNADQFFTDIRVVDESKKEIPYKIEKKRDIVETKNYQQKIDIVSKKNNEYILDMGHAPKYFQDIKVVTNSVDFSRIVDVYGSNLQNSRYEKISKKQGDLISVAPGINDKNIDFKYTNYRFIKLKFSGDEGNFVPEGFVVERSEDKVIPGEKKIFPLKIEKEDSLEKEQKMILEVPGENIPVDSFVIVSPEKDFSRRITIFSSNNKNAEILQRGKRYDSSKTYWKKIYSGDFSKRVYTDNQVFKISDNKKYYLIVIDNGDNEPIEISEVSATRFLDNVYLKNLDFENNSYRLFYGNQYTRKPKYDTTGIDTKNTSLIKLSAEKKNNSYLPPKEKLGKEKPYLIYIFIGLLVLILFWFVYKIMRETKTKDEDDEVDIIDKL